MKLSLRVLAAVGIATVLGLVVTAAAWSRAPSQGSPTATLAAPSAPAPGVTPTPTAGPDTTTGTPAATHTAIATANVPGAVTLSNGRFFPLPEGTPVPGICGAR